MVRSVVSDGVPQSGLTGEGTRTDQEWDVTGESVTATYELSHEPLSDAHLLLWVNGLLQRRDSDYTRDGQTITFAEDAIPAAGEWIYASYDY